MLVTHQDVRLIPETILKELGVESKHTNAYLRDMNNFFRAIYDDSWAERLSKVFRYFTSGKVPDKNIFYAKVKDYVNPFLLLSTS